MDQSKDQPNQPIVAKDARAARRKAELKANMARRKAQARLRAAAGAGVAAGAGSGGGDAPQGVGAGPDHGEE